VRDNHFANTGKQEDRSRYSHYPRNREKKTADCSIRVERGRKQGDKPLLEGRRKSQSLTLEILQAEGPPRLAGQGSSRLQSFGKKRGGIADLPKKYHVKKKN